MLERLGMLKYNIHKISTFGGMTGSPRKYLLWYCTLAGVERLDAVRLDAISKNFLKSTEDKSQSRPLSQMEKGIILESVSNALKTPLKITRSQHTQPPAHNL